MIGQQGPDQNAQATLILLPPFTKLFAVTSKNWIRDRTLGEVSCKPGPLAIQYLEVTAKRFDSIVACCLDEGGLSILTRALLAHQLPRSIKLQAYQSTCMILPMSFICTIIILVTFIELQWQKPVSKLKQALDRSTQKLKEYDCSQNLLKAKTSQTAERAGRA